MSDTSNESSSLGATIRQLREGIGISQAQLADGAKISQGYLSQIENDEVKNPSAAILLRLANTLEIDPSALFVAAGYGRLFASLQEEDGFSMPIYLPLLQHVAKYNPEQQRGLLGYLQSIENGVHGWEPRVGAEH